MLVTVFRVGDGNAHPSSSSSCFASMVLGDGCEMLTLEQLPISALCPTSTTIEPPSHNFLQLCRLLGRGLDKLLHVVPNDHRLFKRSKVSTLSMSVCGNQVCDLLNERNRCWHDLSCEERVSGWLRDVFWVLGRLELVSPVRLISVRPEFAHSSVFP